MDMIDTINAYVLGNVNADDLGLNEDQVIAINTSFHKVDIEQLADDEYDAIVEELAEELEML